ncbi:MAG: phenylalanine--tRNA ligase subunit beta [Caldimicrobium sp.]|nr:phenylalanine--tRNA ligase subunit beta [Caldimicrobium sp.]MDW8182505.1 phenylalanine--tRNA ligase subunit beta [Caldimicrobium sp.]
MRVPITWLAEFIDLRDTPEKIAEILTLAGHEVEEIFDPYRKLGEIVSVKILEVLRPEDLREVCLCKVTDGKEVYTVLTTAIDQVKSGQVVAFAKPGSMTFDHRRIETKVVKGYESKGSFVSPFEAGVSEIKDRLLIFSEETEIGKSIYDLLQIKEPVLEVAITPNRGDLLSIYGITRELHLITGWDLKVLSLDKEKLPLISYPGRIEIQDTDGCYRYAGRYLRGVKVGESPFFVLKRLFLCGQRPINNIVDITNYVLLELGQPLHAFDWNKIRGGEILIRRANPQEKLTLLDGREIELHEKDLVIADREEALVLAGIMGGESSGVSESTEEIFLESAWFNPKRIRLSGQRHRITTESSYRFERKVDPEGIPLALKRATELILALMPNIEVSEIVDQYPCPYQPPSIDINLRKIHKILGFELGREKIDSFLFKLGEVKCEGEAYSIRPFSYRQDLSLPEDLVEEIARLYGYDQIPTTFPKATIFSARPRSDLIFNKKVKEILRAFGFYETINYSFINPGSIEALNLNPTDRRLDVIRLTNPISHSLSVMRTTLLPGLLETARFNIHREVENLRIFEVGKVFYPAKDLAEEREFLGLLLMGDMVKTPWEGKKRPLDLFDLKGVLEAMSLAMKLPLQLRPGSEEPFLKAGQSFDIYLEGKRVGYAGAMKKLIIEDFDLKEPLFVAELDLEVLVEPYFRAQKNITVNKPPKYPSTFRDITCVMEKNIPFEAIEKFLLNLKLPYLEKVDLVALYEGEPIPQGHKSISLRFWYRAEDHTLRDEEVEKIHEDIAKGLFDHFRAKPR